MKTLSRFLEEAKEAKEVLNKISSAYERKHPGMKLSLQHNDRTNTIRVNKIEVPKEKQGKGIGSRAMRGIASYAQKQNLPVTLTPEPEKGKKAALNRFYNRHGFKKNKDLAISDTLIKNP